MTKWEKGFKEFLLKKEFENTECWTYPYKELDSILVKFCFAVCRLTKVFMLPNTQKGYSGANLLDVCVCNVP